MIQNITVDHKYIIFMCVYGTNAKNTMRLKNKMLQFRKPCGLG